MQRSSDRGTVYLEAPHETSSAWPHVKTSLLVQISANGARLRKELTFGTEKSIVIASLYARRKKLTFPRKTLTFARRFCAEISLSTDKTSPLHAVLRENTTFTRSKLTFVTFQGPNSLSGRP
jgi:hypothetical protein